MLKTKLAGVVAVAVLLSAGVANAAPSSANETQPFSFTYESMRDVRSGATSVAAPASPSEAAAHSVPVRGAERSTMAERLSRTYGMFPTSVNESGSL